MQFKNIAFAALASSALAQNSSLCDKYTLALTGANNATTQYTVLTLLVNTVVIGNYSPLGVMNAVPGILANGTVGTTAVSLLKYFDGALASTNRGNKAVSVNFLDDGGAVPLTMNKPANGTSSNQYFLLTHLYSYFGALLGCSTYGSMGFPAYGGIPSMYSVHKYMALDPDEVTYFIMQVGLAATSFGVTVEDATAVGTTLAGAFNYACLPAAALLPNTTAVLNSICSGEECPAAPMGANCSAYANVNANGTEPDPVAATSTYTVASTAGATGTGTGTASGSATASASAKAGAAANTVGGFVLVAAMLFALAF